MAMLTDRFTSLFDFVLSEVAKVDGLVSALYSGLQSLKGISQDQNVGLYQNTSEKNRVFVHEIVQFL